MSERPLPTLDDKYTATAGRIMLSGVQALVRLPLVQRRRDRAAGLDTAGYISGYRGSPIGGYDNALWRARTHLERHQVRFQPGVNEDLAATAVWGTQQLDNYEQPLVDGVFSIWYGKGPGVDRSLDAIKHGNYSGTHRNGGVLLVFGDDHPGKSSTIAHQSEQAMAACAVPVLYPATVEEIIHFGLTGFAMSRHAGCWVGMKTVNETIERTEIIDVTDIEPRLPASAPENVHFRRNHFAPVEDDMLVQRERLPAARAFAAANGLDRAIMHGEPRRLGIVTAGKSYLDVRRALSLLGLTTARAAALGVGLYKVGMIWPLEERGLKDFARGYEELLFVEEKRPFLEEQAAGILYGMDERPAICGKRDPAGATLFPSDLQLDALQVARVIAGRLQAMGIGAGQVVAPELPGEEDKGPGVVPARQPFFCSGCPHNTSTRLPEGSIAGAGIGCHGMTMSFREDTRAVTQMGGEGANWVGAASFTGTGHIFQNLGDGTYFHSGLMAIRAAVAAGVNVTYKILFNDAVALTGGQPIDGPLSVAAITHQLRAEGVQRIALVSDHPEQYGSGSGLAAGVSVHHRDELDPLQRQLREVSGVSALVYEQTCAAEKRRRRKRGTYPDPPRRVFINPGVCEGCGDCSEQSTCMSIFPLRTRMGTKRRIDQSSCNKDYSCLKGFCPSFITVEGGELRKVSRGELPAPLQVDIAAPAASPLEDDFACMIAGVGGTGVVTVGAVMAMAAMLDGLYATCFDMTGLAQKGGAVFSHLRLGRRGDDILAAKLGRGEADLMLAFDAMAALAPDPAGSIRSGTTRVLAQEQVAPNAALALDSLAPVDLEAPLERLRAKARAGCYEQVDAAGIAERVLGDAIGGNMLLLGYALQRGLLPLSLDSLEQAIRLNAVSVEFNLAALRLGRLVAAQPALVARVAGVTCEDEEGMSLDDQLSFYSEHLRHYQDAGWASRFERVIERVRQADRAVANGGEAFTAAAAASLAKLMSYKDEYEVARLHSEPAFLDEVRGRFTGDFRIRYHLSPPLLASVDPRTGVPRKYAFGPWIGRVFPVLARLRFLRGTPFDPFGYTRERRLERAMIEEYIARLDRWSGVLDADNYAALAEAAGLPQKIRGFGHVKARNIERYWEPAGTAAGG